MSRPLAACVAAATLLLVACSGGSAPPPGVRAPPAEDALPPPTSDEVIDAALATSQIDEGRAAVLQILAQVAPERLPPEFYVAGPLRTEPSSLWFRIAEARLPAYGEDDAAVVRAVLASPEDPAWLVFPAAYSAGALQRGGASVAGGLVAASNAPSCLSQFGIDEAGSTVPARYLGDSVTTKYFRLRVLLPTRTDVPAAQRARARLDAALDPANPVPGVGGNGSAAFGTYLDDVFDFFLTANAMRDPRAVLAAPLAAADHRIPIYVLTCEGTQNYAGATGSGTLFASLGGPFEDPVMRRVILPHELFHLFEYAYQAPVLSHDLEWPYEAMAVAVEDLVAPDVKRWSGRHTGNSNAPPGGVAPLNRAFHCPEEPFHSNRSGACEHVGGADRGGHRGDYSRFVYLKYLWHRGVGRDLDEFWSALSKAGGDPRNLTAYFGPERLAGFARALLVAPAGAPEFDPEDRALFFRPGQPSVDYPSADPRRYTFSTDAVHLRAGSPALRLAPGTPAGLGAMKRLDGRTLPIPPKGTHRWLIEVPTPDAAESDPMGSSQALELVVVTEGGPLAFQLEGLGDAGGGPPRTFDWTWTSGSASPLASVRTTFPWDLGPRWLLATVTNASEAPLAYRATLNLTAACWKRCLDHYEAKAISMQCAEHWCQDDPAFQGCVDDRRQRTRGALAGGSGGFMPAGLCSVGCSNFPSQESLLSPPASYGPPDALSLSWGKLFCDLSDGPVDCGSDPAAFVGIPSWPSVTCDQIW